MRRVSVCGNRRRVRTFRLFIEVDENCRVWQERSSRRVDRKQHQTGWEEV